MYRDFRLNCPRCSGGLVKDQLPGGHDVQQCDQCKGKWLSPAVFMDCLNLLNPQVAFQFTVTSRKQPILCPSCQRAMEHISIPAQQSLPPIPLDRCEAHGYWFDNEELQQTFFTHINQEPSNQWE